MNKKSVPMTLALIMAALPAYGFSGQYDTFGSVFVTVFLAYCALILVSQLIGFLRLRCSREDVDAGKEEKSVCEET